MILIVVSSSIKAEVILPEVVTPVQMSNRDMNRIVCTSGDINDAYFSAEKGVTVKNEGSSSYVKFLIKPDVYGQQYVVARTELYVVCDGDVYTLMVSPRDIPGQTVRLSSGRRNSIGKNVELLGGLAEEERAVNLTMGALQDDIPSSFEVVESKTLVWINHIFRDISVAKRREIQVEGFDLYLTEYGVKAKRDITLNETLFLNTFFGNTIFAVTLDNQNLKKGQVARAFIIEKRAIQ